MKIFLDTNVLLDVLVERTGFLEDAAAIWSLAESGRLTGCIAAISVTNIYYIVRKFSDHRTAMKAVIELRDIFTIATCDSHVMSQAIDARMPDFEDAVQYFTALNVGAKTLITRNPKHFARSAIPVVTPKEFRAAWSDS